MIHIPIDKLPSTIAKMLGVHAWASVTRIVLTEDGIEFTTSRQSFGDTTRIFDDGAKTLMVSVDPNVVLEVSGKTGGRR